MTTPVPTRATFLGPAEMLLLQQWGERIGEAFPPHFPYLVGSALHRPDFRDVDVRLMLDDDEFEALTGGDRYRLRCLKLSFTLWGKLVTGLPIDFQFQDTTKANAEYAGRRNALFVQAERRR